eukprot:256001_1
MAGTYRPKVDKQVLPGQTIHEERGLQINVEFGHSSLATSFMKVGIINTSINILTSACFNIHQHCLGIQVVNSSCLNHVFVFNEKYLTNGYCRQFTKSMTPDLLDVIYSFYFIGNIYEIPLQIAFEELAKENKNIDFKARLSVTFIWNDTQHEKISFFTNVPVQIFYYPDVAIDQINALGATSPSLLITETINRSQWKDTDRTSIIKRMEQNFFLYVDNKAFLKYGLFFATWFIDALLLIRISVASANNEPIDVNITSKNKYWSSVALKVVKDIHCVAQNSENTKYNMQDFLGIA